jgi:hypothetical protein
MNYAYAAREKAAYYTMLAEAFKPASLNSRKIANDKLLRW